MKYIEPTFLRENSLNEERPGQFKPLMLQVQKLLMDIRDFEENVQAAPLPIQSEKNKALKLLKDARQSVAGAYGAVDGATGTKMGKGDYQ